MTHNSAPFPRIVPRHSHANIRHLRHAVREWGEVGAPKVILLHGWMDSSASWQFLMEALPPGFHCIAFDWRGFGDSEWPQDGYWFADYHADLDALMDRLCPDEPVHLVGHSMGGNIACIYAGLRPHRIRTLASLEGFGLPEQEAESAPEKLVTWLDSQKKAMTRRPYLSLQTLAERFREANPRLDIGQALYLAQEQALMESGQFWLKHDPRHRSPGAVPYRLTEAKAAWKRVTAPTLWVQGDDSELLKRFHGSDDRDLSDRAACFANIRRSTLQNAGHMLHHDQPEALASCLKDFWNSQPE